MNADKWEALGARHDEMMALNDRIIAGDVTEAEGERFDRLLDEFLGLAPAPPAPRDTQLDTEFAGMTPKQATDAFFRRYVTG